MSDTPKVTIDGTEYAAEDLSDEAKAQFNNVQLADKEIVRLNMQLALAKTARNAYAAALKSALPQTQQ